MSLGTVTAGLQGAAGGGGATIPQWSALPAGTEGDVVPATLGGGPIVAERGPTRWHPGFPSKAQIASLWPSSDQSPGVRVGPMPHFWRALAEGRPPKVLILGDSTTSPGWMSVPGNANCRASGWPALMASSLGWRDGAAYYGPAGLTAGSSGVPMDNRVTYSASWAQAGVIYTMGAAWTALGVSARSVTFTPAVECDRIVVRGIAIATSSAITQVYVDDVLMGTLVHNDDPNRQNPSMINVDVLVPRGMHAIRCNATGSSGTCYVHAIETYDSLNLVPDIYSAGVNNNRTLYIADTGLPYSYRACIEELQPDVVVLSCAINDLDAGDSIATVLARNQTILRHLDRTPCDFVGMIPWCCDRPNITPEALDAIRDEYMDFAQQTGGACIDGRAVLGRTIAEVNPAYVADTYHLLAAGNAILAPMVAEAFK